jgi:hypothetical protein
VCDVADEDQRRLLHDLLAEVDKLDQVSSAAAAANITSGSSRSLTSGPTIRVSVARNVLDRQPRHMMQETGARRTRSFP